MVIDTSAIIAILFDEPERSRFSELIVGTDRRLLSAANLVEASIVADVKRGELAQQALDLLVHRMRLDVVPVDQDQAAIARRAFRRFGRGRHAAKLNYGDCFAYALADASGEPLLFKGMDFAQTDITPVVY